MLWVCFNDGAMKTMGGKEKQFIDPADERKLWSIIQQGGGVGFMENKPEPRLFTPMNTWMLCVMVMGRIMMSWQGRSRWRRQMLQRCLLPRILIITDRLKRPDHDLINDWWCRWRRWSHHLRSGDWTCWWWVRPTYPSALAAFLHLPPPLWPPLAPSGSGAPGRITPTGRSCSPAPGLSVPPVS